jgi:uncharacterized protein YnzC (UPF0291/DUF896 family)
MYLLKELMLQYFQELKINQQSQLHLVQCLNSQGKDIEPLFMQSKKSKMRIC